MSKIILVVLSAVSFSAAAVSQLTGTPAQLLFTTVAGKKDTTVYLKTDCKWKLDNPKEATCDLTSKGQPYQLTGANALEVKDAAMAAGAGESGMPGFGTFRHAQNLTCTKTTGPAKKMKDKDGKIKRMAMVSYKCDMVPDDMPAPEYDVTPPAASGN